MFQGGASSRKSGLRELATSESSFTETSRLADYKLYGRETVSRHARNTGTLLSLQEHLEKAEKANLITWIWMISINIRSRRDKLNEVLSHTIGMTNIIKNNYTSCV
jgi:hypothetical protein